MPACPTISMRTLLLVSAESSLPVYLGRRSLAAYESVGKLVAFVETLRPMILQVHHRANCDFGVDCAILHSVRRTLWTAA
jgi:hypothetical protein